MNNVCELIDCYFCDTPYPNSGMWLNKYSGIMICYGCEEIETFSNKKLTISSEYIECPICYEHNISIELPNCQHKICICCCKRIYFGYDDTQSQQRPKHFKECDDMPEFPYKDSDGDVDELKLDEYLKWEYLNIHPDDYELSVQEIVVKRNNLKLDRPEWMNTELFLNYEDQYINLSYEIIQVEKTFNVWIANKVHNIKNTSCPLCRK